MSWFSGQFSYADDSTNNNPSNTDTTYSLPDVTVTATREDSEQSGSTGLVLFIIGIIALSQL